MICLLLQPISKSISLPINESIKKSIKQPIAGSNIRLLPPGIIRSPRAVTASALLSPPALAQLPPCSPRAVLVTKNEERVGDGVGGGGGGGGGAVADKASPTRPEREEEVVANSTAAAGDATEALLLAEAGEWRGEGEGLGSARVVAAREEGGKLWGEGSDGDELSVEQHGPGAVLTADSSESSDHIGGPSGGGGDGDIGGGAAGDGDGGAEDRGFRELWKALHDVDASSEEGSPPGMIDNRLRAPGVADADGGVVWRGVEGGDEGVRGCGRRERYGRGRASADFAMGLDAPAGAAGSSAAAAAAAAAVYGSGVGDGCVGNGGRGGGSGAEGKSGRLTVAEVQAPLLNELLQLDGVQGPELRAEGMIATLTAEDTRVSAILYHVI